MRHLRKVVAVLMGFGFTLAPVLMLSAPVEGVTRWVRHDLALPEGFEPVAAFLQPMLPAVIAVLVTASSLVVGWGTATLVVVKVLGWKDAAQ